MRAHVAYLAVILVSLGGVVLGSETASALGTGADLRWTRQFGTPSVDIAYGIAAEPAGVYVAGTVAGPMPGETGAGGRDAFVRKYDGDGNVLWTREFGTSTSDVAHGVAVDASSVYVVGETAGTFPGQPRVGDWDAFLRRYDADGSVRWTRQFGTAAFDVLRSVAVDPTGVYVTGWTEGTMPGETSAGGQDAFVRKYAGDGTVQWTRQFGTTGVDFAWAIATDGSGAYVVGETRVGPQDAFLQKFDPFGTVQWTRSFGTPAYDAAYGVAVGAGGVYVTGVTHGTFPGETRSGLEDAFLRNYDLGGTVRWTRQFGSSSGAIGHGVAADPSGAVVAGEVGGALPGETGAGAVDAFLRRYDESGNVVWTGQFGTPETDHALAVAAIPSGLYVAGRTTGALTGETSAGDQDAFAVGLTEATSSSPCPLSQGYWKNHPEAWPVSSLTLGAETYDAAGLLVRLRTPPRGDASLILAHQLIAAKLNLANGTDAASIATTIADADGALRGFSGVLPYGVRPATPLGRNMTGSAEILDEYNNGLLSPGCGDSEGDSPSGLARPDATDATEPLGEQASQRNASEPVLWAAAIAMVAFGIRMGLRPKRHSR